MNVKLNSVLSDNSDKSGMAIIYAMVTKGIEYMGMDRAAMAEQS